MKLTHINLNDLKIAPVNVRKHGPKDIADLVPSIRSLGLIQPLLVRANCEGIEVVAGQRRFHALSKLAAESTTENSVDPVPCLVMDDEDDAKALEASLAENIARLPMDEVDQYKAFAALKNKGQSVDDIAARFGISERLVKQRLALGNLIDPILNAYRKDTISPHTLRNLTMASKKQQRKWLALHKSETDHAPQGAALRDWLFGGADISTETALFDLDAYSGAIISDLFGEDRFFDDADTFWTLQNAAIANAKEAYLEDGWQEVNVLERGNWFARYDHEETAKEDGGRVYIQVLSNGEVTLFEGFLTDKEAQKREKLLNGEDPLETPDRPELTKAMQSYLDLHRHAAVRTELLTQNGLALRVAVAQIIAGSALWSVQADPQKTNAEAIAGSLQNNTAQDMFEQERLTVLGLLGLEVEGRELEATAVPRKSDWGARRDVIELFVKLLALDDETVTRLFTFVVAETLPCGSVLVEALGQIMETDMSNHWQPDETFFDLLRDKQAINAILKEVGGKVVADAHITSTAKIQKSVIRQHLDGTRKPYKPDWQPRYAQFPMRAYTKQGSIEAVERGKAIKAALKAA